MPFWFLPKEIGLKGAVYADAGSVFGYQGATSIVGSCNGPAQQNAQNQCISLVGDDGLVRSSVGVGLIWQSPFGPLRFDYAVPLTKGQYDRTQQFRFGGGTSF
jgi:outer membrane protein insertion porin family